MRWSMVAALVLAPTLAIAHAEDETRIVQGAYLTVKPQEVRIELNLIPGTQITRQFLVEVDTDADGDITQEEAGTYATSVLARNSLTYDGEALEWVLDAVSIPSPEDLASGADFIRIFAIAPRADSAGEHILAYRNNYGPEDGQWTAFTFFQPSAGFSYAVVDQSTGEDGRSVIVTYRATL